MANSQMLTGSFVFNSAVGSLQLMGFDYLQRKLRLRNQQTYQCPAVRTSRQPPLCQLSCDKISTKTPGSRRKRWDIRRLVLYSRGGNQRRSVEKKYLELFLDSKPPEHCHCFVPRSPPRLLYRATLFCCSDQLIGLFSVTGSEEGTEQLHDGKWSSVTNAL